MNYNNVSLHNVAEVVPHNGGVRLQRAPEWVRAGINERSQEQMLKPLNSEIRFVSDSEEVEVVLSSEGETQVWVYNGPFSAKTRVIIGKEPTTLSLRSHNRILHLEETYWKGQPFDPRVWRVVFGGTHNDPVIFHEVRGKGVRPPKSSQLPKLRYLAYGTSITQGASSTGAHLSYVGQTAWRLGADVINLGSGGSCHCEKAFADYIAGRKDWNIATLSLSVNMQKFPLDEFHSRVEYMVNTVAGSDTSRPVACITLFPYFRDMGIDDQDFECGGTAEEYRQILRDVVKACPHPNVHQLEGPELLTNIGGLTTDLIHPSDLGMIQMGENVAKQLKALL